MRSYFEITIGYQNQLNTNCSSTVDKNTNFSSFVRIRWWLASLFFSSPVAPFIFLSYFGPSKIKKKIVGALFYHTQKPTISLL
jgi:hypothetical protein